MKAIGLSLLLKPLQISYKFNNAVNVSPEFYEKVSKITLSNLNLFQRLSMIQRSLHPWHSL